MNNNYYKELTGIMFQNPDFILFEKNIRNTLKPLEQYIGPEYSSKLV